MKYIIKNIKKIMPMLVLALAFFAAVLPVTSAKAEESTAAKVAIVEIDYDKLTLTVNPNENTCVYYSDSKKTTWNLIEGSKDTNGNFVLDISWISSSKDYVLNLKGDKNEEVVSVTLPKVSSSLKVKFDKVNGVLTITSGSVSRIEWKKALAYSSWTTIDVTASTAASTEFAALRGKGAKIYVRVPQVKGDSSSAGSRPGKIVQISIPKIANAPSLKVDVNKLTLNTSTAMEYRVYSVNGVLLNTAFTSCVSKMELSSDENISKALYSSANSTPSEVVVAVRKKATTTNTYSKTAYITIPAQAAPPKAPLVTKTETKYSFRFDDASKTNTYQYAVVKPTDTSGRLSWKNVSTPKEIILNKSSYPEGTKVYIRIKGVAYTKKTELALPSAALELTVGYSASATASPAPTSAAGQ